MALELEVFVAYSPSTLCPPPCKQITLSKYWVENNNNNNNLYLYCHALYPGLYYTKNILKNILEY